MAYRLREEIGRGAVATVHRVLDEDGRVWAGKRLHASLADEDASVARFEQEAALLAGLTHPNVVEVRGRVTAIDEAGGPHDVLLMELVEGVSLDVVVARSAPLDEDRIIGRALDIARGLAVAHEAGVIHRDLKPGNVLLAHPGVARELAKLADFGLARASSLAGVDSAGMAVLGTPAYMAPECVDPLAVDARSDLYALGCMIYEMATGTVPYDGPTPFAVLEQHRSADTPSLATTWSPGLRALVDALLAKSPGDRPQSADTVADALERLQAGEQTTTALVAPDGGSACASCGQPLIPSLATCLNCGFPTIQLEQGGHSVVVTGPGGVSDKLDADLRERLRAWITQNPALGLEPGKWLADRIPRLPFTVVGGISESGAAALTRALVELGFEAEAIEGSALRMPVMRKKAKTLTGRLMIIAVSSMAGVWNSAGMVVVFGLGTLLAAGVMTHLAVKAVTKRRPQVSRALPPAVTTALARVDGTASSIRSTRHRHALRAVVRRSVELATTMPEATVADVAAELADAIDQAMVAATRLDALDHALAETTPGEASDEARALLHARDRWSARLLSLTASLDAFAARRAAASVAGAAGDDEALDDLRARIEALEEVQAT